MSRRIQKTTKISDIGLKLLNALASGYALERSTLISHTYTSFKALADNIYGDNAVVKMEPKDKTSKSVDTREFNIEPNRLEKAQIALFNAGYITYGSTNPEALKKAGLQDGWRSSYTLITPEGLAFLKEPENVKRLTELYTEDKNIQFVATKKLSQDYSSFGVRKKEEFGMEQVYRVVKETANRIYIEDVKAEDGFNITEHNLFDRAVDGNGHNRYIDKNNVFKVGITPDEVTHITQVMQERKERMADLQSEMEEAIKKAREPFESRMKQLEAMYIDELNSEDTQEITGPKI